MYDYFCILNENVIMKKKTAIFVKYCWSLVEKRYNIKTESPSINE